MNEIIIDEKPYKTHQFNDIDRSIYYGYVYITINLINNKKYVGSHSTWNRNYIGSGRLLIKAIKKYGRNNFANYIIDLSVSKEDLKIKEEFYINKFNACKRDEWYNISCTAHGGNTISEFTEEELEEFKKNISNGFKNMPKERRESWLKNLKENHRPLFGKENGMYGSARFGDKNPMFGKKHSAESILKNSESNKGKQAGENNPMYGKTTESIRRAHSKPILVFKDDCFFGEFESILEFSKLMGSKSKNDSIDQQVRKLVRGYAFKQKHAMFYGWRIVEKEIDGKKANRY